LQVDVVSDASADRDLALERFYQMVDRELEKLGVSDLYISKDDEA
jgi:hypothetical protein